MIRRSLGLGFVVVVMLSGCGPRDLVDDAGARSDAGVPTDAGSTVDAGSHDAGPTVDAGLQVDGGLSCTGKKTEGDACTMNNECCGYPALLCSPIGSNSQEGSSRCVKQCTTGSDCGSGCCYYRSVHPYRYCADRSYCLPLGPIIDAGSADAVHPVTGSSCAIPGEACGSNATCCGYTSTPRLSACIGMPAGQRCAAECTTGSDCVSGCCQPIASTVDRLCMPRSVCE